MAHRRLLSPSPCFLLSSERRHILSCNSLVFTNECKDLVCTLTYQTFYVLNFVSYQKGDFLGAGKQYGFLQHLPCIFSFKCYVEIGGNFYRSYSEWRLWNTAVKQETRKHNPREVMTIF